MDKSLQHLEHRPWPLPTGPWIMKQVWHDLLFIHWPVPIEKLRPLIPASLEIDTYQAQAWIAVVPFRMSGVRARWTPALPGLSAFPEMNVRTYVSYQGKPGVFFFSLDATNLLAVCAARLTFHLPYFHAQMSLTTRGNEIEYRSRRKGAGNIEFKADYQPTGPVFKSEQGSLEWWLTERYCLYAADKSERIFRGEIHHRQWPLQTAACQIATNTMTTPIGIELPPTKPLLHFAKRQDVIVWAPTRV